jgi:uncharacterized membrane protein YeaQ/YmgE (transglycosylase-associated protein family)
VGLIAQHDEKETTHGMLINLLAWLIVGAVAGWLASRLTRGVGMGVIGDIIVGIVGVLLGGVVLSYRVAPYHCSLSHCQATSLPLQRRWYSTTVQCDGVSLLAPGAFALTSFNVTSLVVAFIGAVSLLFVVKLFTRRRAVS